MLNETFIRVHRQWNDWRSAEVRLRDLEGIHWFRPVGAPRPLIHGFIRCNDLVNVDLMHECIGPSAPHRLLVCVLRKHTVASVFHELEARADRQLPTGQEYLGLNHVKVRTDEVPMKKMPTHMILLLVLGLALSAGPVTAQESKSASLAAQLGRLLSMEKLEAIAAVDPDDPDRFVAALFFPGTQLLVVSARARAPIVVRDRITRKQYRDVYLDLQGSSIQESKVFFHDMSADGLRRRGETVDLMSERGADETVFNGDWRKLHIDEKTYEKKFDTADQEYSRLLNLLIAEASKLKEDHAPAQAS